MAKLSVNINKVATLRNARGGDNPDVLQAAQDCELYGAQGITVHPRPDERHIRRSDVDALAQTISTELNIEGYPSEAFMEMVCRVRPTQVTLVPDSPEQLTSNAGWDTQRHEGFLTDIVSQLKCAGIRCRTLGLGINAGHDLSLENLYYFAQHLPALDEVSIGHALICDALRIGLHPTIQHYLNCLQTGR